MIQMPKRFTDRAKPALKKFQKILESARTRDVNESDTSLIVSDFLAEVLGYSKYEELTREFAIKSQFCDLAIKIGDQLRYLIEVKSIGTSLRDNHLNQAIAYGSREGVEWVLLTNGIEWQAHRLRFEQPVQTDLLFTIDLLDPAAKQQQLLEKLFLISKEASTGAEIDKYYRHQEATSRYVIAQIMLDDAVVAVVRRQLRALFEGVKISEDSIREVLQTEVLKRDVLDGEKAAAASKAVRRAGRKRERSAAPKAETPVAASSETLAEPDGVT